MQFVFLAVLVGMFFGALMGFINGILDRYKGEEMLLEDVGARMFITRERARQIEEKALKDLEAAKDLLRRKLYSGQRVWRPETDE
jgi:ribose/xylose/arabinose/galactoside ABC-type transport system permease subunit